MSLSYEFSPHGYSRWFNPSDLSRGVYSILSLIREKWPEFLAETSEVHALREKVHIERWKGMKKDIHYLNPLLFNQAFFAKNFLKASACIAEIFRMRFVEPGPAIDVGAGAGPAAWAWSLAMPYQALTLVDESAQELSLAQRIASILDVSSVRFIQADILDAELASSAVRLYSYWLCEQHSSRIEHALEHLSSSSGPFIMIDYSEFLERAADFLSDRWVSRMELKIHLSSDLRQFIPHTHVNVHALACRI